MDKEFVPYEQALALKELGFDEPCFMFYEQGTRDKYLQKGIEDDYWGDYSEPQKWNSMPNKPWKPFCQCISAPTYSQAFRWFRLNYGLKHDIDDDNVGTRFYYKIKSYTDKFDNYDDIIKPMREEKDWAKIEFKTYEEAELACLRKLLEIVKNEN